MWVPPCRGVLGAEPRCLISIRCHYVTLVLQVRRMVGLAPDRTGSRWEPPHLCRNQILNHAGKPRCSSLLGWGNSPSSLCSAGFIKRASLSRPGDPGAVRPVEAIPSSPSVRVSQRAQSCKQNSSSQRCLCVVCVQDLSWQVCTSTSTERRQPVCWASSQLSKKGARSLKGKHSRKGAA